MIAPSPAFHGTFQADILLTYDRKFIHESSREETTTRCLRCGENNSRNALQRKVQNPYISRESMVISVHSTLVELDLDVSHMEMIKKAINNLK